MRLLLASSSPRRRELLTLLHRPFDCEVPEVEELRGANENAGDYVTRLAEEKAQTVSQRQQTPCLVIGSDTLISFKGQVLEKPESYEHFSQMMKQLSGQTHQVLTSVSVCHWNSHRVVARETALVTTQVEFAALSQEEIDAYWATGEPHDKAAGYGIQGYGGKFVKRIEGSYFAVVGLPLYETEQLLRMFEMTGEVDER
ncbi:septum formation protein [Idiomarina loihiensis]|uniref:Maf family protein n=1 Tax=Idiomarina TaxID=135575 RepID=UPI000D716E3C|nr:MULTISPECIES: Maf family protein [Idiomarina]PWW37531.1 septum formation protein [Idiomarina loihiensis]TDP47562.1 septum formation protein [Idiomarina loihiensis]TDS23303.1 septum formation protein [Idiomarina sp. H2]